MQKPIIGVLCAAILTTAAAPAAARPQGQGQRTPEASIAFANRGGIFDWEATGRDTLYVQDRSRHWYRATLLTPCLDLPFANTIGFDANPNGSFDRFSNVIVRGQRCPVASFVRSDPPPRRARKPHR